MQNESIYTVKFFDGDYRARQEAANKWGADLYFEQHFNSKLYEDQTTLEDNPILTVIANNASATSLRWAESYSGTVHTAFPDIPLFKGIHGAGVLKRRYKERGDFNLRFTDMPAILGEPFFISDQTLANRALEPSEQQILGHCVVSSIRYILPRGGKIALSIGHMGKTSSPFDRGAPITKDAHNPEKWSEAHLAQAVLDYAAIELRALKWPSKEIVNFVKSNDVEAGGGFVLPCPHCKKDVKLVKV